jgi:hypothetical protein
MASPVILEMGEFLVKVLHATQKGSLAWETTADPDIMFAPLGGEYSVKLEQVEDFEGNSSAPDHILTLLKGRRPLFSLDRRNFENTDTLKKILDSEIVPFHIFKELWDRAYFKASKISDELDVVNKLLDTRLK